jgi:RNA polymerase sigma-70 factor (ECF subfamily)
VRFETLIERYHDEIYGYLWRLVEGSGTQVPVGVEADDLAQDVFLRAYRSYAGLRPGSNYRAWLYKIATNCAYSAFKRGRRSAGRSIPLPEEDETLLLSAGSAGPSPYQVIAGRETAAELEAALAELPVKQQAAVVMRHLQGLDYAEIALALDSSEDSARANVYQGILRLRRVLGQDWIEPG